MRHRPLIPLALLCLLGAWAGAKDAAPRLPRWKSGERTGKVVIDGHDETFVALVPRGFTQRKAWPVVLLAHGNGGHAASFLKRIKPMAGKRPPLLISLERCDNNQKAVGYVPRYLEQLEKQFHMDATKVFAFGFSGGGFRLWDDIVCKKEVLPLFRGVVLVGCGKQSFDPPKKPSQAPTVLFIGDPRDPNYGEHGPPGAKILKSLGYEVLVFEHKSGHSVPRKQAKAAFDWIAKTIKKHRRRG